MHGFIQVRIRFLVILRQIVERFQRLLARTFQALVDAFQTGRIVIVVLFSRTARLRDTMLRLSFSAL